MVAILAVLCRSDERTFLKRWIKFSSDVALTYRIRTGQIKVVVRQVCRSRLLSDGLEDGVPQVFRDTGMTVLREVEAIGGEEFKIYSSVRLKE